MPAMKTSTIQDYKLVAFSVKNKLIVSQITEKKKKKVQVQYEFNNWVSILSIMSLPLLHDKNKGI